MLPLARDENERIVLYIETPPPIWMLVALLDITKFQVVDVLFANAEKSYTIGCGSPFAIKAGIVIACDSPAPFVSVNTVELPGVRLCHGITRIDPVDDDTVNVIVAVVVLNRTLTSGYIDTIVDNEYPVIGVAPDDTVALDKMLSSYLV